MGAKKYWGWETESLLLERVIVRQANAPCPTSYITRAHRWYLLTYLAGQRAIGTPPGTPLARGEWKPHAPGAWCVREEGGFAMAGSCSHALSLTWLSSTLFS